MSGQDKKAQKRAEREKRRREKLEKHALPCPHCGKQVLDHMTQCPYCENPLVPTNGYTPMSEEDRKKIKRITTIVGTVVVIAVIVTVVLLR